MGDLPLALEQAAAYIGEYGSITLDDYLALFRKRRQELLRWDHKPSHDYPDTVATTWEISFMNG